MIEMLAFVCVLASVVQVASVVCLTPAFRNSDAYLYRYLWLPAYLLFLLEFLSLRYLAKYFVGGLGVILFLIWGLLAGIPSIVSLVVLLIHPPRFEKSKTSSRVFFWAVMLVLTIGVLYWAFLDFVGSFPSDDSATNALQPNHVLQLSRHLPAELADAFRVR